MTTTRSLPMFLLTALCACCFAAAPAGAAAALPPAEPVLKAALEQPVDWFKTDAGRKQGDAIVSWQNGDGGWWKTYDAKNLKPADLPAAGGDDEDRNWRTSSTFDNGATYSELRILARAVAATSDPKYRQAFDRGLKYVFDAQYDNGGWPQRFPLQDNYGRHVTYNDRLMASVMLLLKDIAAAKGDFAFVPEADRQRARQAFDKGVECVLRTQIKAPDGTLTAWCQQHDAQTLAPTGARSYELPSISSFESADLVLLLMDLENPDARVRSAVESAVAWFDKSKIHGKRYERKDVPGSQFGVQRVLSDDPSAPPLWARFYEIETNRPFFCDRDGIKRYDLAEVGEERRAKYAWYSDAGKRVLDAYPKWKKRVGAAPAQ